MPSATAEVLEGELPGLDQIESLAQARDEALARMIQTGPEYATWSYPCKSTTRMALPS